MSRRIIARAANMAMAAAISAICLAAPAAAAAAATPLTGPIATGSDQVRPYCCMDWG
jgi:hypothetical protein